MMSLRNRRTGKVEDKEDESNSKLQENNAEEQPICRNGDPTVVKNILYITSFLLGCCIVWLWPHTSPFMKHSSEATLLTLRTQFVPLDPEAFNSFIDNKESRSSLHGILTWKTAAVSWSWMQPKSFAVLLPPMGVRTNPGHVWQLVPDNHQQFMYSYKYVPPPPSGSIEELLFSLLSLFHPQPFLVSRYRPRGAVAVLRARTCDTLDIIFRLHAEYQLNIPPRRPLWFTPAAFIGRLIFNTTEYTVHHFKMDVPTQQELNVDLEWFIGPNEDEDMEVTITHLEKMQLFMEDLVDPNSFMWSQEITLQKAHEHLHKEMYRYRQVDYHNFSKAFTIGNEENRPIHTVVLWGVLEDQSC